MLEGAVWCDVDTLASIYESYNPGLAAVCTCTVFRKMWKVFSVWLKHVEI